MQLELQEVGAVYRCRRFGKILRPAIARGNIPSHGRGSCGGKNHNIDNGNHSHHHERCAGLFENQEREETTGRDGAEESGNRGRGLVTTIGILGGGLTGLTLGSLIPESQILEKEEVVGGLCRSKTKDGFTYDIGGSHVLFSRNE
ncbi:MAG: NAD(P)-binding protein, partial [Methanobacteriota archaeon]